MCELDSTGRLLRDELVTLQHHRSGGAADSEAAAPRVETRDGYESSHPGLSALELLAFGFLSLMQDNCTL